MLGGFGDQTPTFYAIAVWIEPLDKSLMQKSYELFYN